MTSSNITDRNIWSFRDDMLETGCEVDAEYLKIWLSCLMNKDLCIISILSWMLGLNKNSNNSNNSDNSNNSITTNNGLFMSLLKKVRPTSENNTLFNDFSIKIE